MKKIIQYLSFIVLTGIIFSCAKLGSPPGGPKDEEAPYPKKAKPANYSVNYDKRKIIIKFNEFITLKNQFNEFSISPPLEEKPLPLLRGKAIHIELPAEELDSVTYTLDFGQSIADNNEGNPLPNFQFVISKNAYIDSFSVKGYILDAYTHLPDKDQMFIFLNKNLSDTVPYTTIPSYLGRSNPEGYFEINHVAPGTYSIFALKDANNNLLYDLPTEIIAFLDETVTLHPDSFPEEKPVLIDSLITDSTRNNADSNWSYHYTYDTIPLYDSLNIMAEVASDSSVTDSIGRDSLEFKTYGYTFSLYSFLEEEPFNQYLEDYNRDEPEILKIFFHEPQDSLPRVRLLYPDTTGQWYFLEKSDKLDTLTYWLADSNLVGKDSILVEIIHPRTDTNGVTLPFTDTLLFRSKSKKVKEPAARSRKGGLFGNTSEEIEDTLPKPVPRMPVKVNVKKSNHDLNVPIVISTGAPIVNYNGSLIELYKLEDTLVFPVKYKFEADSMDKKKFKLFVDYEPLTKYSLRLYEGCFTDIYNRTIDSVDTKFVTQRDDFYGIVNVDVKGVSSPVIIQLYSKDDKLIKQLGTSKSEKLKFDFLAPGQYSLKVIFDDNNNGKWDTGSLDEKLQPEKVAFYKDPLEVRSNWEVEYTWEFK